MTGRDLISASLRLIGAIAPGEAPAAQEATDGLASLNRMLGSWSIDSLMIPSRVREEFALVANDGIYTIGTGADYSTTRPTIVERATIEVQTANPTRELPLRILTTAQWAAIAVKDLTSSFPEAIYIEATYPNATINLWPVPTAANKLVLYSSKALTDIALDTTISLPPGYEDALVYNLAVRLAPEYGIAVVDKIAMIALESKATVARINFVPRYLRVDNALRAKGRGFNMLTGESF